MRCLSCYYLLALPDVINGQPGEPGMIRRKEAKPMPPGSEVVTEFRCSRCGANYKQTTVLVSISTRTVEAESERERERTRGWKS